MYKRAHLVCCWSGFNLPTPPNPDSQDHMGLTSVLTDVATRLHTIEAIRSVVAAQREAEEDTKGWDRLPPTAKRVILAASATSGTSILTSPPPTIHCFLNARNAMALQGDCYLLLPFPSPRAHTGYTRPGRAGRNFTSPNPSIFRNTRERLAPGNDTPGPPVHRT